MQPVLNAMALNMRGSPTISGMNAVRAGMERASSVPFRNPTQMKSQNDTLPVMNDDRHEERRHAVQRLPVENDVALAQPVRQYAAHQGEGHLRHHERERDPGQVQRRHGHLVDEPALGHELHVHREGGADEAGPQERVVPDLQRSEHRLVRRDQSLLRRRPAPDPAPCPPTFGGCGGECEGFASLAPN